MIYETCFYQVYAERNFVQRRIASILDLIERRSIRYISYRTEWYLARHFAILPKRPLNVDIELSDACNLRCTMCVHGMDGLPNVGHMDEGLAERLILEASSLKIPAIKFNWRGEPGLHPKLIDYIRLASSLGFADIQINTNLVSFTSQKIHELVNSGIHRIIVSCDGATKETYESIRIGSSFDRLIANLTLISELKRLGRRRFPKVRIQFVKQQSNYHEVDLFLDKFKVYADDLRISEVSNRGADGVVSVGDQIAVGRRRCEQPWQRLIISKDGSIHPCCNDWDQLYSIGHVADTSLAKAWNSDKLNDLRDVNLQQTLDSHYMCKNCFVPESYLWKTNASCETDHKILNAFGRNRAS